MSFYLKPSEIRYTQDSVSNTFGNYGSYANRLIGESLDDLLLGYCNVSDIPTIKVININNAWYSADNRRLWVLKKAEELGKCTEIPVYSAYYLPDHKFTTESDGLEIRVRRNPGGSVWRRWTPKPKQSKSWKRSESLYNQNQSIASNDRNLFKYSGRHDDFVNERSAVLQYNTFDRYREMCKSAGHRSRDGTVSLDIETERSAVLQDNTFDRYREICKSAGQRSRDGTVSLDIETEIERHSNDKDNCSNCGCIIL
ncbi:hypothetical protein KUTeg_003250 [Tegillarca granosa]|uniref:Uncharacterized protein n=1 Tax=Tegillarca granosa TaxID=220873 RepID=A0ABQ9FLK5_TEGGR|nr:hypothetical protein KUTeg_003250 [Tegillarca granosa]